MENKYFGETLGLEISIAGLSDCELSFNHDTGEVTIHKPLTEEQSKALDEVLENHDPQELMIPDYAKERIGGFMSHSNSALRDPWQLLQQITDCLRYNVMQGNIEITKELASTLAEQDSIRKKHPKPSKKTKKEKKK